MRMAGRPTRRAVASQPGPALPGPSFPAAPCTFRRLGRRRCSFGAGPGPRAGPATLGPPGDGRAWANGWHLSSPAGLGSPGPLGQLLWFPFGCAVQLQNAAGGRWVSSHVLGVAGSRRRYGEMRVSCWHSAFNRWVSSVKGVLGLRALHLLS